MTEEKCQEPGRTELRTQRQEPARKQRPPRREKSNGINVSQEPLTAMTSQAAFGVTL